MESVMPKVEAMEPANDGSVRSVRVEKPLTLLKPPPTVEAPQLAPLDRKLLSRTTAQVMGAVRWDGARGSAAYRRMPDASRPAGLVFAALNWSGVSDGAPTEHQKAQSVDSVFAAFKWG